MAQALFFVLWFFGIDEFTNTVTWLTLGESPQNIFSLAILTNDGVANYL